MNDFSVTSELYRLLVAQGLAAKTDGTDDAGCNKKAGRGHIGAAPQVMAGAAGEEPHRPTARGGVRTDMNVIYVERWFHRRPSNSR